MERIPAVNANNALQRLIVIIFAVKVSSAITMINAFPVLVYLEYALSHVVLIVLMLLRIDVMEMCAALTPNAMDIALGNVVQALRIVLRECLIISDAMASAVT
jgi:hypothetical protein